MTRAPCKKKSRKKAPATTLSGGHTTTTHTREAHTLVPLLHVQPDFFLPLCGLRMGRRRQLRPISRIKVTKSVANRIEAILDGVGSSSVESSRDESPPASAFAKKHDISVLLLGPRTPVQAGSEVIHPSLAALLAAATRHLLGDRRPSLAEKFHQILERRILRARPHDATLIRAPRHVAMLEQGQGNRTRNMRRVHRKIFGEKKVPQFCGVCTDATIHARTNWPLYSFTPTKPHVTP